MGSNLFESPHAVIGRIVLPIFLATAANLMLADSASAAGKIRVSKAALSARTGALMVRGVAKNVTGPVEIFDLNGRRLGAGKSGKFGLTLTKAELPTAPCGIRVQAGADETVVNVRGAPKSCRLPVTCGIVEPAQGAALQVNSEVSFRANVKGKGPVFPLTYEWDFAGGAMERPKGTLGGNGEAAAKATFVRNDSTYRVRFIASDARGRRCEDTVEVAVGSAPVGSPAKVSEQNPAKLGNELDGVKGDLVVLPAPQWTMQHASDARTSPNLWASFDTLDTTLNAYVYRKDLKPALVPPSEITLQYSAASNPSDPVGSGSINSTSQNWPLGTPYSQSVVRKSDWWESYGGREPGKKTDASKYQSVSWMAMAPWAWDFADSYLNKPEGDVGYAQDNKINFSKDYPPEDDAPAKRLLDPGSQMPGKNSPYQANEPKPMVAALGGKIGANVRMLPVTDIDDNNRVNPFPLMRVQAIEGGQVMASTDGVLTSGKDFKCRECHAKGGIAANPNAPHTRDAFYSTAYAKWALARGSYKLPEKILSKPEFFDATSKSIEDQEYAAALNYTSLHQFYDAMTVLDDMLYGRNRDDKDGALDGKPHQMTIGADSPMACEGCHGSAPAFFIRDEAWWQWDQHDWNSPAYDPDYSVVMHRFHGQLQYKSQTDHSDIKRTATGLYERYVGDGPNALSLFPIFNPDGSQKPMDENCLKCHAGHREQLYRDRMYTAGVSCYDCHGDMLSVGQAYKKTASRIGPDGNKHRVPWFDEPDCGSCHTGNGNVGGDKANGYFSAAVMKRAFDDADRSGLSRKVDLNNTDAARFAVVPLFDLGVKNPATAIKISYTGFDPTKSALGELTSEDRTLKVSAPLFREGKDAHGNVPCAACHGAAHEIWPNRDPNSNDNVTALQLQGHTGTILECSVCHDKDAFKDEANLDGGQYSGDPVSGILGGPHNTHPVNDPYWWLSAPGDVANMSSGRTNGGWHNNYAKKPGRNGEDQCAACHGADHKGTRLSKTPVDRVFVNARAKGVKKKVTVAAGTPIGCDLCHDLEKSFTGSPSRAAKAVATATAPSGDTGNTGMPAPGGGSGGSMGSGR